MATKRITNGMLLKHLEGVIVQQVDVTKKELLDHMQGMKNDLQTQVINLEKGTNKRFDILERNMNHRFDDTQKQIDATQEDLVASIAMLGRHQRKLARL